MLTNLFNTDSLTGIDEAGRGCLAGPVVAAAVTWPTSLTIPVADSKTLTALQREQLFVHIIKHATAYSYVALDAQVVDSINIRQATLRAMNQAHSLLTQVAPVTIIDGIDKPKDLIDAQTMIKADLLVPAVSAASIIAKVVRDRMMQWYHQVYPCYAFNEHKGYGTIKHRLAIAQYGPCAIHRLSFKLLANQE